MGKHVSKQGLGGMWGDVHGNSFVDVLLGTGMVAGLAGQGYLGDHTKQGA